MIARIWRGETPADRADDYLAYLRQTGLSDYVATPGNQGVRVLRRLRGDHTEFVLNSYWDSLEAIRAFAGPDIDTAVYYPEDDAFLLGHEPQVDHFDVVWEGGGKGRG